MPAQIDESHDPLHEFGATAGQPRPLRVMFIITSMNVGGAETLLVNLVRKIDRTQFAPEICCLKERGVLGDVLADEIPVHAELLRSKYDLRVLPRLIRLLKRREIDAIVTVGAGDKMFWGRLAAVMAGVPVRVCALHSTGWPDVIGRLNRLLTPWTDAFVGVAEAHGQFLIHDEKFPADKVHAIPNGVDCELFHPYDDVPRLRSSLGLPTDAPLVGLVAALRPEKDHELFLEVARRVQKRIYAAQFLLIGGGSRVDELRQLAWKLGIGDRVHFMGTRSDVPQLLAAMDVFLLTSKVEANPVSILEAAACAKPVVATRVGSVPQTVLHGRTGYLAEPGDAAALARYVTELLEEPRTARSMGLEGRKFVELSYSLQTMVALYEQLLEGLFERKSKRRRTQSEAPRQSAASQIL